MKRRKSDLITVSEVSEKFRNCGLFVMAERLEEMDRDGSLMSMTPLEAVDQLISSHELSLQNRISERYRKQSKLYIPMANLADIIYKPLTADVRTMRGGIFWYWPDGSWYRLVAGSGTGRNI